MDAAILAAVLVLALAAVVLVVFAISAVVSDHRATRELLVAMATQWQDEREYLVRAVIGKHAGEVATLTRVDDAPEVFRTQQGRNDDLLFDRVAPKGAMHTDPETHEVMQPVGL